MYFPDMNETSTIMNGTSTIKLTLHTATSNDGHIKENCRDT